MAGSIAVPAAAPSRQNAVMLGAVCRRAQPRLVVACDKLLAALRSELPDDVPWCTAQALLSSTISIGAGDASRGSAKTAFLQFSSGSTGAPKGVEVGHDHIAHNAAAIGRAFDVRSNTVAGGWLPLHHDMGLIGLVLAPLWLGIHSVLMPPMAFLTRPARWLRMIDRYDITCRPLRRPR
jgi:acyl-CoA synthetase (AMP-forming)/AMP-acid ligase II